MDADVRWRRRPTGGASAIAGGDRIGHARLRDDTGIGLVVSGNNVTAEALFGYLSLGAFAVGRQINQDLLEQVWSDYGQWSDPSAAAIAGYFALLGGEFGAMRDWSDDFAARLDWFPDAAVIHAWFTLKKKDDGAREADRIDNGLLVPAVGRAWSADVHVGPPSAPRRARSRPRADDWTGLRDRGGAGKGSRTRRERGLEVTSHAIGSERRAIHAGARLGAK